MCTVKDLLHKAHLQHRLSKSFVTARKTTKSDKWEMHLSVLHRQHQSTCM